MGRRKPTDVQRHRQQCKRQREAHDTSDSDSATASPPSDPHCDPHSAVHAQHKKRKSGRRPARLQGWTNTSDRPLTLTVSETGAGWSDALWLRVPIIDDEVLKAIDGVGDGGRIALEMAPRSDYVTLVEPSGKKITTAVATANMFPEAGSGWLIHAVGLVDRELLSFHIEAANHQAALHVGVAWRKYVELCRENYPSVSSPRVAIHAAMHRVMLWSIKCASDPAAVQVFGEQCAFPYTSELELLFNRFVGENAVDHPSLQANICTMPDLYARIDTQRQLQRDVSNFERAVADDNMLVPTLRQYQKAAVSWMLSREDPSQDDKRAALPMNVSFTDARLQKVAYDPYCAAFADWSDESFSAVPRSQKFDISTVRGGILADEMGLGKTVEVISLVLSHPNSARLPVLESQHKIDGETQDDGGYMDCICGTEDDHELGIVQCDFCSTWHHQVCSGYASTSSSGNGLWMFGTDGATPSFPDGTFMCFHCQIRERPRFSSKTTLIVSPEAIHDQWEAELKRHVKPGALSLLRYPGVKALRSRLSSQVAGPSVEWQVLATAGLRLATYDIVLTTYEALRSDLHHLPTPHGRDRRSSTRQKRKRYAFVASPLVFLSFWRVCMDEAQVGVENTRLQAALTVAELRSSFKWVVTGTPFSSHVSDLFGYLQFLGVSPYAFDAFDELFFREAVEKSFEAGAIERVLDLLLWDGQSTPPLRSGGGLLWRTSKKDVLDQLNLPAQQSQVVWCRFSDVERHYYDAQERAIVSLVRQRQRENGRDVESDNTIDGKDRIWHDLLELRKICCHPQIGRAFGGGGNGRRLADAVLTMDEFLQQLVTRSKRECEEAQRKLVAALNGHAGLLVLADDMPGAIVNYLVAASSIRTNWPLFRADLLPRLHILENLARYVREHFKLPLSTAPDRLPLLVDDRHSEDQRESPMSPKEQHLLPELKVLQRQITERGLQSATAVSSETHAALAQEQLQLEQSARAIKKFYLLQVELSHTAALDRFRMLEAKTADHLPHGGSGAGLLCAASLWWNDALTLVDRLDAEQADHLVHRVHARLSAFGTKWSTRFCSQLVSAHGLRLQLVTELETLDKRRRTLFEKLEHLSVGTPAPEDVRRSGNCRKCRDTGTGPVCAHCKLYKELDAYRQHMLGIDNTAATASAGDMYAEDNEDDDNKAGEAEGTAGLSSLLVEVFKEIAATMRTVTRSRGARDFPTIVTTQLADNVQREVELWAALQREWTAAKKLFQVQHQRLGALDELEMAGSQIRLRVDGEIVATATEKLYILEPDEVPVRVAELEADRAAADVELREAHAKLRYLLQLETERRRDYGGDNTGAASAQPIVSDTDGADASSCPVCLQGMGSAHAVLSCAHAFCRRCVETLSQRRMWKSVKCPTCRHVTTVESITIVSDRTETSDCPENGSPLPISPRASARSISAPDQRVPLPRPNAGLNHGGSLGSKIDALLRRVLALAHRDDRLKCLLFSQWPDMLSIVSVRLEEQGVTCFAYTTKRRFHATLQAFKRFPGPSVLALPFKVGANGLNVVEATEVLLVEPLLNAGLEAQAVSRVHRIGQTRPTRVHRFIVESSVEERIHWLGKRRQRSRGGERTPRQSRTEAIEAVVVDDHRIEEDATDLNEEEEEEEFAGVAPSRQEKELLTMGDLHLLLDGKAQSDGDSDGRQHAFWDELVQLNERPMRRSDAVQYLERRHAVDSRISRDNGSAGDGAEPRTSLFGRDVNIRVANELLGLAYAPSLPQPASSEEHPNVDGDLLEFHRARVREELATWTSSRE